MVRAVGWAVSTAIFVLLKSSSILSHNAVLSNFKTDSLKLEPGKQLRTNDTFKEALYCLKNHFIRRHMFSSSDWDQWGTELGQYPNKQQAVRELVSRIDDPYARYLENAVFKKRKHHMRGSATSVGLELSRNFRWNNFGAALRSIFYEDVDTGIDGIRNCEIETLEAAKWSSTAACVTKRKHLFSSPATTGTDTAAASVGVGSGEGSRYRLGLPHRITSRWNLKQSRVDAFATVASTDMSSVSPSYPTPCTARDVRSRRVHSFTRPHAVFNGSHATHDDEATIFSVQSVQNAKAFRRSAMPSFLQPRQRANEPAIEKTKHPNLESPTGSSSLSTRQRRRKRRISPWKKTKTAVLLYGALALPAVVGFVSGDTQRLQSVLLRRAGWNVGREMGFSIGRQHRQILYITSVVAIVVTTLYKMYPALFPVEVTRVQNTVYSPFYLDLYSDIRVGDVVVSVDGQDVRYWPMHSLMTALNDGERGDIVSVGIERRSTMAEQKMRKRGDRDQNIRSIGGGGDRRTSHWEVSEEDVGSVAAEVESIARDKKWVRSNVELMRDHIIVSSIAYFSLPQALVHSDRNVKPDYVADNEETRARRGVDREDSTIEEKMKMNPSKGYQQVGGVGYIAIREFTDQTFYEVQNAMESLKHEYLVSSIPENDQNLSAKRHPGGLLEPRMAGLRRAGNGFFDVLGMPFQRLISTGRDSGAGHRRLDDSLLKALVIDLRGNPGGTLIPSLDVSCLFLSRGDVVIQMGVYRARPSSASAAASSRLSSSVSRPSYTAASLPQQQHHHQQQQQQQQQQRQVPSPSNPTAAEISGTQSRRIARIERLANQKALRARYHLDSFHSTNRRPNRKTAILLLTDGITASSSEILVAALCDNQRAQSMGSRTYGKNVMQAIMTLSDGSGLCFSVREFFSPNGKYMGSGHVPFNPVQPDAIDLQRLRWDEQCDKWYLLP